ncbi:MAG: V-type ATP synthase subunit I [Actinobacteria bacterium]|nr:V-type ATP synthase subunit I [Actinomycetota bacterium]
MLVSMAKVQVIGPKRYFYDVIGTLHQLGILHIEDVSKKLAVGEQNLRRMSMDEKTAQLRSNLENILIRVNGILTTIQPAQKPEGADQVKDMYYHEYWRDDTEELKNNVNQLIAELDEKTRDLANARSNLELELNSLERYQQIVQKIEPLARQIVALEGFETVAFLLESKYKSLLDLINKEMSQLTHDQFEIVSTDVDDETTAALAIFNKRYSTQVHQFLAGNVNEVRLPPDLAHEPFDVALAKISERRAELPKTLAKIKDELAEISKEWYLKLSAISEVLRDRTEELGVVPQFAQTDFTFVITGWLPVKQLKKTEKILHDRYGERIIIAQLPVDHHELEEAPIVFENPSWSKPFEVILKILQPPRYGTVDPTPFLAIFIPAFFGLIVGDVGYGLLIFFAGLFARMKFKGKQTIEAVGSIFMALGISAMVFGFLFGEAFGNIPKELGLLKHIEIGGVGIPFERVEGMMTLLYITIGLGLAHIMLGLILGVVNSMREKATKHASERAGQFLLLFATVVGLFIWLVLKSQFVGIGFATAVGIISVALIFYGAGFLGIMEIFGLVGNIFSYARIMALGLAGVILAEVANELAIDLKTSMPGIGIVVGGLIALLLHVINLVVGAFSPTIHSIRLNVLEFFNRFYEPGGKEYKPFKARR